MDKKSRVIKEPSLTYSVEAIASTADSNDLRPNRILHYLGYAFAIAGLVWVFHDVKLSQMVHSLAGVRWWWLVPAVACDVTTYVMQGQRWARLLRPAGQLSARETTEAIYAGLFVNEIMPLRLGELLRMYLVAAKLRVSLLKVVPSVAFERLLDTLCLAAAIGPVALFVPLSPRIAVGADALGIVAMSATFLAIIILMISPAWILRQVEQGRSPRGLLSFLSQFVIGMQEIKRARQLAAATLLSFLILLFQGLSFWLTMIAFGLKLSLLEAIVVALVVRLGTAIPNAPANIGAYQFFCVLGLLLFGIDKTQAAGFSLFVFTILTLPMVLIGAWAISREGFSLATVRQKMQRIRAGAPA